MNSKRRYRCAIYTRKSHEEGLDQDFNSLDAQREACEAYILSQAGLGWEATSKTYEDGGVSGAHMERNGLKQLLSDIKTGIIDVVVVYKVDRLTRSIIDFGKLVEVFDEQDVSFVSVTQAFNTTNSMGRLTLNVLLSFAQFEREVTAERIRDKIASSKQKGMWMGGRVPFGYRNEDKKLILKHKEADAVKLMFDLYQKHKSIRLVKEELDKSKIISRIRTNKAGLQTGGTSFSAGNIASILNNPIYIGDIKHKDKSYQGNHEAIITKEQWQRAQAIRSDNTIKRQHSENHSSPALLNGLVFDENQSPLICHHANKKGKRYYYYVSKDVDAESSAKQTGLRIPIRMLEQTIVDLLIHEFTNEVALLELIKLKNLSAQQIKSVLGIGKKLASKLTKASQSELGVLLKELIIRIDIGSTQVGLQLNAVHISSKLKLELPADKQVKLTKPIRLRKRGQEMKLVLGGIKSQTANKDQTLIALIAKAHLLREELETQTVASIKEFANKYKIDHADAKNLVPFSYLSPYILEEILAGRQPANLNTKRLKSVGNHLPLNWEEQGQVLGFAS
jgi:DNA invertase Pin-like site-specific DNA recombinase